MRGEGITRPRMLFRAKHLGLSVFYPQAQILYSDSYSAYERIWTNGIKSHYESLEGCRKESGGQLKSLNHLEKHKLPTPILKIHAISILCENSNIKTN